MSKFNIYDSKTWSPSVKDAEENITNRAVGAIGQKIGELKIFKQELNKRLAHQFGGSDNVYSIAKNLLDNNPKAAKIMQLTITYPDNLINSLISDIDRITEQWKNVDNRRKNWRALIPIFEKLRPYMEEQSSFYNRNNGTNVVVSGNEAWSEYLRTQRLLEYCQEELKHLKETIVRDDDDRNE